MRTRRMASSLSLFLVMLASVFPMTTSAQTAPAASVPNMVSVVVGTDGQLYWNGFYLDHWGGWQPLFGGSPSPPGLCQSAHGRLELVVQGYDEDIYHKSFVNGTWSSMWDKVPTGATSDTPACAVLGTTMYVVVKGTDYQVWATSLDLNTGIWSPWVNLGGASPSAPALAASPSINALDLVVRGNDNHVYHKFYVNGTWSTWDCGCAFATWLQTSTPPAIVSGNANGTSIIQVAVLNSGNLGSHAIYSLATLAGRSWTCSDPRTCTGWATASMLAYSAPTLVVDPTVATSNNAGTVYVVSRGQDGGAQMGFRTFDPNSGDTWSYLFNAGGNTGNRPAAGMAASGKLDVVVSGASKDLWYNSCQCCCLWSGWTMMTGATALDPGLINVP